MIEITRIIYGKKLDLMGNDELIRYGSELAGLYISFGNMHATARAQSEIASNVYKQIFQNLHQAYIEGDDKYKVTEARNRATEDLTEESEDVLKKEYIYKQWDNILDTCKTLIMFIQSALSTKKSELYLNSQ